MSEKYTLISNLTPKKTFCNTSKKNEKWKLEKWKSLKLRKMEIEYFP